MTANRARKVTVDEYLAKGEVASERSELIDGQLVAMAGNKQSHVKTVANLMGELFGQLRGKACEMLSSDMKVKVELTGDYFYPDLVGYCEAPQYEGDGTFERFNK